MPAPNSGFASAGLDKQNFSSAHLSSLVVGWTFNKCPPTAKPLTVGGNYNRPYTMTEKILEGKLLCYSEQGMEGGYLSIQDTTFISLTVPTFGVIANQKVWDKNDYNRIGLTSNTEVLIDNNWLPFPDPICKEDDYKISSLFCGEINGDLNADKRLSEKYNFKIKYSVERLNETYGQGNWRIDRELPNVILKDGTLLHFGDTPTTIPSRPYGIPQGGKTRVAVNWNDGIIEEKVCSDKLLVEQSDYKGLHILKSDDILKVLDPKTKNIIYEGQLDKIPLNVFSQTIRGHFAQDNNHFWEQYFSDNYYAELHRIK